MRPLCNTSKVTKCQRLPESDSPAPDMIEALDRFRNRGSTELFDAGDEPVGWQRAFPDILLDCVYRDLGGHQPIQILVEPRRMREPLVAEREPRRILALHRIVDCVAGQQNA